MTEAHGSHVQRNLFGHLQRLSYGSFQLSAGSSFAIASVLHFYALGLAKKISRHFLIQTLAALHAFSHALRRSHVFTSSSDWFIGLRTSVVIGKNDYFGFGLTTLS